MSNWMIEPRYTAIVGSVHEIRLDGVIFVFGSGKLTHEDIFLNFDDACKVKCYDPLYKAVEEKPAGRGDKFEFFSNLDEAIGDEEQFDSVVALFSLHYEPAWISAVSRLVNRLKLRGKFVYAEDRGFRAALDGTLFDSAIHASAEHIENVFQERHEKSGGVVDGNGIPWLPGIRASDYSQLTTLLGAFGFKQECESFVVELRRTPVVKHLQDEARSYLPWKSGAELLANMELGESLVERVEVHQLVKGHAVKFPEALLHDSPAAEVLRGLVFKHATAALGQLRIILPQSTLADDEMDRVYSRLTSFGHAWLSILYQHIARQVPKIEALQLIFQRAGDHEDMVEALTSEEFEEQPVFFACAEVETEFNPWDYKPTTRYTDYAAGLKKGNFGYLAKPIFESGTSGVYWDGTLVSAVEAVAFDSLNSEFARRSVPAPCLYIPARLAHVERGGEQEPKPLTLIAMIVYFREASPPSDAEWRNLHPLLLPLLYSLSARVALGEMLAGHQHKRLRMERERSHQMLLKLQRPLDALTKGFADVQAEAQEMQAIINDPEEGVFAAHKTLAALFHQGYAIQISSYLTLMPEHNWSAGVSVEKLQQAYCYALACIFGVQNRLLEAPSHAALVERTRSALKEKREAGVNSELIELLTVLCNLSKLRTRMGSRVEIEDSVHACRKVDEGEESVSDVQMRYSGALDMLKRIAFTPFKSFGQEWPTAPVQVAAITKSILNGTEALDTEVSPILPPQDTPFSQHAILSFIIGLKSEIRSVSKAEHPILALKVVSSSDEREGRTGTVLSEYRLTLPCPVFGKGGAINDPSGLKLPGDSDVLQDCIRSTIRYGIVGKVMGSFHGIFQDLLRHGLNLATADEHRKDAWVQLTPPAPTWDRAILLVLGKANADRNEANFLSEFDNSKGLAGRYFAVVQEQISTCHPNPIYQLRIIWASEFDTVAKPINGAENKRPSLCGDEKSDSIDRGAEAGAVANGLMSANTGASSGPVAALSDSAWPQVVCIDHDGTWFSALKEISFLDVVSHQFDDCAPDWGTAPCVVVLHGREPKAECSAASWAKRLRRLIDDGKVLRVIVVSGGGHPSEKGIEEGNGFLWGVIDNDAIQNLDMADKRSVRRNKLLSLIRRGTR